MKQHRQFWQNRSRALSVVAAAVVFGVVGAILLAGSHAATPTASLEAETGTISSAASTPSDTTASSHLAVKFGSGAVSGNPDPLCTWSGIANQQFPCAADTGYAADPHYTGGSNPPSGSCPSTLSSNTTYNNCFWNGTVVVSGNNVTINDSLITGGGNEAILCADGCSNLHVNYTTIDYTNYLVNHSQIPTTAAACAGGEAVLIYDGPVVLEHIHMVGWSDGPRWGSNTTVADSYLEGCGIESRGDHADIIQGYQGGGGNVARHNTLIAGRDYAEDAADLTFSADRSVGQTYDNNLLVIGTKVSNPDQRGFDIRGDDMTGTITVTNNVFDTGSHSPALCTTGPPSWVWTNNKLVNGTVVARPC